MSTRWWFSIDLSVENREGALEKMPFSFASIVAGAVLACSFGWGVHVGCAAYNATPNLEPFEVLVESGFSGQAYGASKVMYLFGPMLFACIAAIILIVVRTEWLDERFGSRGIHERIARIFVAIVFVWLMIMVSSVHASHAMSALAHMGSANQFPESPLIAKMCRIAG